MNGCVNDVQIRFLQYVSDQDEFHVTVVMSFVRVEVSLVCPSCSAVGKTMCPITVDLNDCVRVHNIPTPSSRWAVRTSSASPSSPSTCFVLPRRSASWSSQGVLAPAHRAAKHSDSLSRWIRNLVNERVEARVWAHLPVFVWASLLGNCRQFRREGVAFAAHGSSFDKVITLMRVGGTDGISCQHLQVMTTHLLQNHWEWQEDWRKDDWHGSACRPTMYVASMDDYKTAFDVAKPRHIAKLMKSQDVHGWIVALLLRAMKNLEGQATFGNVECMLPFTRCIRQESVEAPDYGLRWQCRCCGTWKKAGRRNRWGCISRRLSEDFIKFAALCGRTTIRHCRTWRWWRKNQWMKRKTLWSERRPM